MPIRSLAVALLLPLLVTGCTTQRDTPDMEEDPEVETTPETETEIIGGAGPNMQVVLFGTWDYTMSEIDGATGTIGGEPVTGTLVLSEDRGASRMAMSSGVDAPLTIRELDVTNQNFVLSGTIQADEGAMPVTLAGSLNGREMSAEANVEGMGTYALAGTRRAE